jgi:RimJ/RimL family protein N-acetyltransferase
MTTFDLRPMRRQDLDTALAWARQEGWNPGLDDAAPFYATDPSGFLMGWIGGEPIGCISVVKYGPDFAFLGLYIVRPEHRGKGYGKAIWDAGIASAAGRSIGLDGVVAQQENYRKSGFALAHKSARWGGAPYLADKADDAIQPVGPHNLGSVLAYDSTAFPAVRKAFLTEWCRTGSGRQAAAWIEGGAVRGYGVIRPAVAGYKIGPLFADSTEIAEALLSHLIARVGAQAIFIDIPEPNAAARSLAQRIGLTPSFETARMYLGATPRLPLSGIFGISTLELG